MECGNQRLLGQNPGGAFSAKPLVGRPWSLRPSCASGQIKLHVTAAKWATVMGVGFKVGHTLRCVRGKGRDHFASTCIRFVVCRQTAHSNVRTTSVDLLSVYMSSLNHKTLRVLLLLPSEKSLFRLAETCNFITLAAHILLTLQFISNTSHGCRQLRLCG